MSHLGQRLSALVDGELGAAERDRVLAHLAGCDACRQEAAALRALKRRMHSLGEAMADTALTGRLMAMAASGEAGAARPAWRPRAVLAAARWLTAGLVASAMVGVGAAAFFVGGEQPDPGPKVTPAVDSFLVEHGIVTGDVPAAGSTATGQAPAAGGSAARAHATAAPAVAPARRAGTARTATAPSGLPAGAAAGPAARTGTRGTPAPSATERATARAVWSGPARRRGAGLLVAAASPGP